VGSYSVVDTAGSVDVDLDGDCRKGSIRVRMCVSHRPPTVLVARGGEFVSSLEMAMNWCV